MARPPAAAAPPEAPAPRPRSLLADPRLQHPAVAIAAVTALFLLGPLLSGPHRLAYQLPTAAFGAWPGSLLARLQLRPLLGPAVASALELRAAALLFLLASALVIAVARRWPRLRDGATALCGAAWVLAAAGWRYPACMLLLAALIHYGLRRLDSHVAMAVTVALLLLAYRYALPPAPFPAGGFLSSVSSAAVRASMVMGGMRLVMYAFELRSVRRSARSFLTVLAYSPLGLFLWPADPPMTSYLTYTTKASREALDRQGARQLYRSGLKYVVLVALLHLMSAVLPPGSAFAAAPPWAWLLGLLVGPAVFYLRISLVADLAYGLSSFAGYHTTDAFDRPFLAANPMIFWQTWNVPVMSFLRRAFIFPLAKQRRSAAIVVASGMLGSALLHAVIEWQHLGRALSPVAALAALGRQGAHFTWTGLVIMAGIPLYRPLSARGPAARAALTLGTQLLMCLLLVGTLREVCPLVQGVPTSAVDLLALVARLLRRG